MTRAFLPWFLLLVSVAIIAAMAWAMWGAEAGVATGSALMLAEYTRQRFADGEAERDAQRVDPRIVEHARREARDERAEGWGVRWRKRLRGRPRPGRRE